MTRLLLPLVAGTMTWLAASTCQAASLSAKDVQIIAKALTFLDPAPAGGTIAVAYAPGDAPSKADADAIAALFSGVTIGSGTASAKAVETTALGDGSQFVAIIVAQGGAGDQAMSAAKAHKIPCISASPADVQAGHCMMSVQTDGKVDITLSGAAAQAAGVSFQSSFRMLIHEI